MTTMQLEALLQRSVRWTGSGMYHQEYIVGKGKQMRVRVYNACFRDVMGKALTIAQIQVNTD